MKILAVTSDAAKQASDADLIVVLYGRAQSVGQGQIGEAIRNQLTHEKLRPSERALDVLSIALAAFSADLASHRKKSEDGWTREFDLTIAVSDTSFWLTQIKQLEKLLGFLTTDKWKVQFVGDGLALPSELLPKKLAEEEVVLLSGGLDSAIGAIDLQHAGRKLVAVSQTVRGDAEKQRDFAHKIGTGLLHYQFNHNAEIPDGENPPSQRARSLLFLAYGTVISTCLARYADGHRVTLNVCENGLISINPPLTGARLGSLSTRTTHPVVIRLFQEMLNAAGIRIDLKNPYQHKTKGEMLVHCLDQQLVASIAHQTTSCGRFKQYGYKHCGRCVPCLIRRSAFFRWGVQDRTNYVHDKLSVNSSDRAQFDDVRSALMAVHEMKELGTSRWLKASLSGVPFADQAALVDTVGRGIEEVGAFLAHQGVK